jgi:hypothetical protein
MWDLWWTQWHWEYFTVPCQSFYPLLHTHDRPSSGAGNYNRPNCGQCTEWTPFQSTPATSDRSKIGRVLSNVCDENTDTRPRGHKVMRSFIPHSLYQIAPQLFSRDGVAPVPDPLFLRRSGSAGNQPGTSGSVDRNSDHQTTKEVRIIGNTRIQKNIWWV